MYEICAAADGYDTLCLEANVVKGQVSVLDFQLMYTVGISATENDDPYIRVFPNPSDQEAVIQLCGLPSSPVRAELYSITGNLVRILVQPSADPGCSSFIWDGKDMSGNRVPGGIYLCKIHAGERSWTKKIFRF
jgi:hypothetical protein